MARKGRRSSRSRRDRAGPGAAGDVPARERGRVFVLRSEHLALLAELDRIFPELAPIVDFSRLAPGSESIEVVSHALLAVLQRRFEQPLFLAFCQINSERALDGIVRILDRGAYPFD